MRERKLRKLIENVRDGSLSRRAFITKMAAAGLSAPFATQLLAHSGVAMAQTNIEYAPTKRGGGGTVKLLLWQAPTLLNPHFAVGSKDQESSRIFYEPLAGWSAEGELVAILAAELPSRENGSIAADGRSPRGVKTNVVIEWHRLARAACREAVDDYVDREVELGGDLVDRRRSAQHGSEFVPRSTH